MEEADFCLVMGSLHDDLFDYYDETFGADAD